MQVFIGDFAEDVSAYSIRGLLGAAGREARFRIERNPVLDNGICYCVADIEPDSLAHKVIAQLKGARFQGRDLRVREFITRAHVNDRRRPGGSELWEGPERRQTDRRRT